jgi:hypothetical protein
MTTENETNDDSKKRLAPACEVFDMLTAHAEQYQTAITISRVQQDIKATFGVDLARGPISSRLRNIASKGLIERAGGEGRGWWVFSAKVLKTLGLAPSEKQATRAPKPRGLLKAENGKKVKNREFREIVEAFIRVTKKKNRDLVFTADSVLDYLRLNGLPVVPRERIAKAIGNMIFQQRGVVKTERMAVYCVPASEERFNKSAVQRPDVAVPKSVGRKAVRTPATTELQQLFRAAAEGHAVVQKALVRLSDLIGNFKE